MFRAHKLNLYKLIFIVISILFLAYSFTTEPKISGDGNEYYLMLESLYNHNSPDLQMEDIISAKASSKKFGFVIPYINDDVISGYYESNTGDWYSYHFFAYPLMVLPVKYFVESFNFNDLASFQIFNSLLFIFDLSILFRSGLKFKLKFSLTLLMIFNPILWYITWTHPEVFSFCFAMLYLITYLDKRKILANTCIAIAALQNPPLILFGGFVFLVDFYNYAKEKDYKRILLNISVLSLSLLPMFFYYIYFGVPNLIAAKGYSSLDYISFSKFLSLFFSPLHGIVLYTPVIILSVVLACFFSKEKSNKIFILFALTGLCIASITATTTPNWNSGMSHIIRYATWIYPMLFLILALTNEKYIFYSSIVNSIFFSFLFFSVTYQSHLYPNSIAKWMISNYPFTVIIDKETLCENAYQLDGVLNKNDIEYCFLYDDDYNARIAYLNNDSITHLETNNSYKIDRMALDDTNILFSNDMNVFILPKGVIKKTYFSWNANTLPSVVGVKVDAKILSNNISGFLSYGPYVLLNKGIYSAEIEYLCVSDTGNCGQWDIVLVNGKVLSSGKMDSTDGVRIKKKVSQFSIDSLNTNSPVEIRTFYSDINSHLEFFGLTIYID